MLELPLKRDLKKCHLEEKNGDLDKIKRGNNG